MLYDYQTGRDHACPLAFLQGFRGILQCDGHSAYKTLSSKQPEIELAGYRVDEDVTALIPHRPGRAQLRHPVLHGYCFAS